MKALHVLFLKFSSLLFTNAIAMSAEACRQGAGDPDHNNVMLSTVFLEYGKMPDHVVYLPKLCLVKMQDPPHKQWSGGADGPAILGPSVYMTAGYQEIRCPPEKINYDVVHEYAKELVKNDLLPVVCDDETLHEAVAVGFVLIALGYQIEAYTHYNKMLEIDSSCAAFYYGRSLAYAKSGLTHHDNAKHSLNDLNLAMENIGTERKAFPILERRAEVYKATERLRDAYNDYSRILRLDQTKSNIYLYRGGVLYQMEQYGESNDDFKKYLESNPNHLIAMHYAALCLYHMGRLREAAALFLDILALKPDYVDVIQSLGQTYRELGDFESAIKYFDRAIAINPTDARANQYKAQALYHHGDALGALKSFKACSSFAPYNVGCQFMKGASFATLGQFYPAIKEFTKVMLGHTEDPTKANKEYITVHYLREWCRYLHSHLERPLVEMSAEVNLSADFRNSWVQSHPFNLQNYTEQPGIQPHIKDVEIANWDKFSPKKQLLVCKARHLGLLIDPRDTDGFFLNERRTVSLGLASLHISQAVSEYFKLKTSAKISWRELFDIAVKWRRLVEPVHPVLWVDQLPVTKTMPSCHYDFIKGDQYNIKYMGYLRQTVDIMKKLITDFTNAIKSTKDYVNELEKVGDYASVMKTILKYGGAQVGGPEFMLGTKVPSVKERGRKHLDGFTVELGSLEATNHTALSIDITTKKARTQQYHAELDFLWEKIVSDVKKLPNSENPQVVQETLIRSILTLAYYFYNLMPLSRDSEGISYATTIGLLLAIGKEITGKIPHGKVMEMEALLSQSPEEFSTNVETWMHLKKAGSVARFPDMLDAFPTLRSCLEVLNLDLTQKCK